MNQRQDRSVTDLEQRLYVAERLVRLFQLERVGYMIVTFLTIMVLIAAFYQIVVQSGSVDKATLVTLFGSSGLVTLSSVRVLKMFNDVLQEVFRRPAAASGTRAKRPADTEIQP